MPNFLRSLSLSNAAFHESARIKAETVDVDQLLLALLATGGPVARVLGESGVGLASARKAVARRIGRQRGDEGDPTTQAIPVGGLDHEVLGDIPWTARASELFPAANARVTDIEFLVTILDDGDAAAETLDDQGVDVDHLRRSLSDAIAADDEASIEAGEDTLFENDEPSPTLSLDHTLAQPVVHVWDALVDPGLVALWAGSPETSRVVAGGVETTFERIGSRGYTRLDPVVVEEPSADGARVVWRERQFSDKVDGEPGGWYELGLTAAGPGCTLRVTRSLHTSGALSRALMPLARRSASNSLGPVAQDIAYGSARRS